jgi:hypothetical protein
VSDSRSLQVEACKKEVGLPSAPHDSACRTRQTTREPLKAGRRSFLMAWRAWSPQWSGAFSGQVYPHFQHDSSSNSTPHARHNIIARRSAHLFLSADTTPSLVDHGNCPNPVNHIGNGRQLTPRPKLDKLVGLAMLVAATVVFLYYSVWTLLMVRVPFFPLPLPAC